MARSMRPGRLFATLFLLAATATAVWVLVRVVWESTLNTATPATSSTAPSPTTTAAPHPTNPAHKTPKPTVSGTTVPLGVYAGPGAVAAASTFSVAAGAPVPYAFDYLDGTSWSTIESPAWFLQRWNGTGFQMMWGVPMLPYTGGATLAAGAAGAYNSYFTELAQVLVDGGQGSSLIVLGWDPGDPAVPWAATTPATAQQYVAYWRAVVTAMRSVPDQQFLFVWDAAAGYGVLPSALYPGNAYVDVVATDAFDVGLGLVGPSWSELASAAYGPDWFGAFADQHKKLFMIAKWGVVPAAASGGGDDPGFVSQFLRWADTQNLLAAVVWDDGSWALTNGSFPRSAAMLHTVAAAGAVTPMAKAVGA